MGHTSKLNKKGAPMKTMAVLFFSIISISNFAFADAGINITCHCSITERGIIVASAPISGSSINLTQSDLNNCILNDGVVVSGCWKAKMNVQYNCQEAFREPGAIRPPAVIVDDQACYDGQIEKEDGTILRTNNPKTTDSE